MDGPRKVGRPSLLTPDVADRIIESVRAGNYRESAARMAGIDDRTLFLWLAKGRREKTGNYYNLYRRLMEAEAQAEADMVKLVREQAKIDAVHARWWLERKFHHQWGKKTIVHFDLLDGSADQQAAEVLKAVFEGQIAIEDALQIMDLVRSKINIQESVELAKKLEELEEKIKELAVRTH